MAEQIAAEIFSETIGPTARKAGVMEETVRHYADLNLVECIRINGGVRLFKPSAPKEIRRIFAQRMARQGRPRKAQGRQ